MSFEAFDSENMFVCRKCGRCCKGYGGTFVTAEEIEAIACYRGSDPEQFVADYCRLSGGRPLLSQKADGHCIFWDGLCTIHPVKPQMCRAWPFIESIVADPNNWLIMADSCPGIRADIPVHVVAEYVKHLLSKDG